MSAPLLGRLPNKEFDACGRINPDERARWSRELEALAAAGDFYFRLVYHRVSGLSTVPRG